MSVSLILIQKIISLFAITFLGIIVVRAGILKPEESRSLSVIALYLSLPCVIISAFCIEYSPDVLRGLLLAAFASIVLHILMIVLTEVVNISYPFIEVEKDSIIYTNSSALVIPLVIALMGNEWGIYSIAFMAVQLFFTWSHGKMLMCHERRPDFVKMIRNPNMIATLLGVFIFLFQIPIPGMLRDTMEYLGDMIAASGMLATGMLIGNTDLKSLKKYRKIWGTSLMRMLACPVVCLLFLKYSGISGLVEGGKQILFVTFLASITPSGLSITQMAQVYGQDAEYCSMINILTTILSIITIPILVMLYQI